MAIKKSELYSSLWASCDALRGGMDASQYKDYVLFMLFIKYVTDKYADSGDFAPPVSIPEGASFNDMVKLKGKPDIGDKINTQIIQPLIEANDRLARSDFPDFNDPNKLGEGKAMVDRLTDLISIFQKPELNFAKNRAEHDDILGDAYEYLMRHFASESGKSKGQFYTPSEVSRILAQVLGIGPHNTTARTVAYDPTCGSGSLLLKVAAEAGKHITLEGQEKDVSTAGLARMNMILHDFPTASIMQGNTLANPKFKNGEQLRTYDYVVANPPFSDKAWSTGIALNDDLYQRFSWGVPPAKQGDYAYLLHVVRSMNSTGKAAIILPHGVLFRGNAEAVIRKQLVRSGYLKGIIGFPANLFYGTGIPACALVLDKENAQARKGIFMLDAAKGFIKDGNKNRLREQDIHRIVDTFNTLTNVPGYARMVPFDEISGPKNDYNLNLPRYIDTSEPEDLHDIHAHLNGGIPVRDIDGDASALPPIPGPSSYWQALPGLRQALFKPNAQAGYADLAVESGVLKTTILEHPEFASFRRTINGLFAQWREQNTPVFKAFDIDNNPKELITKAGEDLLETFRKAPLLGPYDIYQHLMDYWAETLQDDTYEITADGWVVKPKRIVEEITSGKKKGQTKDKGWACDLIPKPYIVARYFSEEQATLDALQAELESTISRLTELEEEHGGDEGVLRDVVTKGDAQEAFIQTILDALKDDDPGQHAHYTQLKAELDTGESELAELSQFACMASLKNAKGKLALKDVKSRHNSTGNSDEKYVLGRYLEADKASKQNSKQLKALLNELEAEYRVQLAIEPLREQLTDLNIIADYIELTDQQAELKKDIKEQDATLDLLAYNQYAKLNVDEIKTLAVDDKWLTALEALVKNELERVSQTLTGRVRQLADRYATPLPELTQRVEALSARVDGYLKKISALCSGGLLSGQVRLPGFDGDWEQTTLGQVASFHKGKGLPKDALDEYGNTPCIHYGELFTQYAEEIKETISRTNLSGDVFCSSANDVLMPTSDVTPNGLAKASCITNDDVILGGDILVIRTDPEKVNGIFLSYIIRNDESQVLRLVTGTTVYHLYGSDMKKFNLSIPPLPEQQAIVEVLTNIDAETKALEQRTNKVFYLKKAMTQGLLPRRTRLV